MQTEHSKATEQVESTASEETRQETEIHAPQQWRWVEAAVWTVRMLAALVNGVKACPERGRRGGKWFSLMDKIHAERTLQIAWQRVRSNRGAKGYDRISIKRFEGQAEPYLQELLPATQNRDLSVASRQTG